ncbi:VRR-NUC domain-containing protein [Streptococcus suis]
MRERFVERKLVSEVKKRGGICPKWVSPSFSGVPDRLVFLPNGKFGLVEVKAPDQKPRMLQVSRHKLFGRLGFKVYVIDRIEMIGEVLDEIDIT